MFENLVNAADHVAKKHDYSLSGSGERHGSQEWTWSMEKPVSFLRYFSVSITSEEQQNQFRIELWAGADHNHRFTRQLVAFLPGLEAKADLGKSLRKDVVEAVEEGIRVANALKPQDLSETRPIVRSTVKPLE